jgi:hypothetical protein
MASARSFMNATPNEEFPSEETSFVNMAPLPKKKKTINFEMKKEKAHSEVLTSTQRKLSWKK